MPDDRYYPVSMHEDGDGSTRYYEMEGGQKKTYAINSKHLFKLPRVFSIFCQGTGGHRYGHCKELITEFHSAYWDRADTADGAEDTNEFYNEHYYNDFLILDGVGRSDHANPAGEDLGQMEAPHPMPGDFWPCSFEKQMKPSTSNTNRDFNHRVSEMWIDGHTGASKLSGSVKHRGDVMGDGWNDNVAHTLFVLNELLKNDRFPDIINLIGWSRGAVTTIKVASAIQSFFVEGNAFMVAEKYQQGTQNLVEYPNLGRRHTAVEEANIALNLFAIDPVPGRFGKLGSWGHSSEKNEQFPTVPGDQDYQNLPPIVKKCVITLALDERRSGFAPICKGQLAYGGDSRVVWLPFPGIHRTQLRMAPRDPEDDAIKALLTSVPRLVFDLAWKFMTSNGTAFQKNLLEEEEFGGGPLTLPQIVDLYSDVWLNRANYHETRNQSKTLKLKWRKLTGYRGLGTAKVYGTSEKHRVPESKLFTSALGAYVEYPGFFINIHHQACFEKNYPSLFLYLTDPNSVAEDRITTHQGVDFIELDGAVYPDVVSELDTIFADTGDGASPTRLALEILGFTHRNGQYKVLVRNRGVQHFNPGPQLADPGRPVIQREGDVAAAPTTDIIRELGLLDYPDDDEDVGVEGDEGNADGAADGAAGGAADGAAGGAADEAGDGDLPVADIMFAQAGGDAGAEVDTGAGIGPA